MTNVCEIFKEIRKRTKRSFNRAEKVEIEDLQQHIVRFFFQPANKQSLIKEKLEISKNFAIELNMMYGKYKEDNLEKLFTQLFPEKRKRTKADRRGNKKKDEQK